MLPDGRNTPVAAKRSPPKCEHSSGSNADRPAFLLVQGKLSRPIVPVTRSADVVVFYDYSSASAHTGFEESGVSKLFLYRDAEPGGQLGKPGHHHATDSASASGHGTHGAAVAAWVATSSSASC